ncbi:MAG: polysaccharide biosynthesis protein [Thermodesulfobacteriota bacterium]|nr:MAG: polysaccharide biosynthesis protein [Thermodesulfobacteriota bacterium]
MLRGYILRFVENHKKHKLLLTSVVEVILFAAILVLAYWIRLGDIEAKYLPQIMFLVLTYLPVKIFIFWIFSLYKISFRYFSLYESLEILKAAAISAAFLALIGMIFRDFNFMQGYPRSVVFIDLLLTFLASSGIRHGFSILYHANYKEPGGRRALIVGAGDAGVRLLRELKMSNGNSSYKPLGFIDDDPGKLGSIISGTRVLGNRKDIPDKVKELEVEALIISIPSATSSEISAIMQYARDSGVEHIKIMPDISDVLAGKVTLGDLKEVSSEDFLGRESVSVEVESIASYIEGKCVLVTGAGGSIGSELCRQISSFAPKLLIMLDVGDTELFYISREMNEKLPKVTNISVLADVKDIITMRGIFEKFSPEVIFHAAAYKHVPLLENNPREAILNNIEGTKVTALLSAEYSVKKFIFISTDKAVNPTSVMGTTKRISENMLKEIRSGDTEFVSVRFGNVLDSRGSVIPIFRDQVRRGGPVTVTHPDMTRFFMSIREAVYLVLQAGALGRGGEVFVLDMGEPVRILDLAHNIIRFFGLEPDKDVPIIYTGLRPGEKLFEEILTAEEDTTVTIRNKIFIAHDINHFGKEYVKSVKNLINKARNGAPREVMLLTLKELVPTYKLELPRLWETESKKMASTADR